MLYTAASENYLDINKVIQSPANEFLTYINFLKRKNELESARLKSYSKQ